MCIAVIAKKSQVDACLDAYDAQKMARNTDYVKASELTKDGKIMAKNSIV